MAKSEVSCFKYFCLILVDTPKEENIDVEHFIVIKEDCKEKKEVFVNDADEGRQQKGVRPCANHTRQPQ